MPSLPMSNPQPIAEAELQALLDQVPKTGGSYQIDPVARTVTRVDEPTVMPEGAITARDADGEIHHEISAKQEIAAKVEAEAITDPAPAAPVAAIETAATVLARNSRTKAETPSTDTASGDTPTA